MTVLKLTAGSQNQLEDSQAKSTRGFRSAYELLIGNSFKYNTNDIAFGTHSILFTHVCSSFIQCVRNLLRFLARPTPATLVSLLRHECATHATASGPLPFRSQGPECSFPGCLLLLSPTSGLFFFLMCVRLLHITLLI